MTLDIALDLLQERAAELQDISEKTTYKVNAAIAHLKGTGLQN